MLVGAYRDNEVGSSHPLTRKRSTRSATPDATVQEIVLAPARARRRRPAHRRCPALRAGFRPGPWRNLVHEKTGGNPFFAIQFFTALAEEGLLRRDSGCGSLGLGLGSDSRARLHRQRGGSAWSRN
jgi:hypothetical protein